MKQCGILNSDKPPNKHGYLILAAFPKNIDFCRSPSLSFGRFAIEPDPQDKKYLSYLKS